MTNRKLMGADKALIQIEKWKRQGDQIIFTNGCFDILHSGHVICLEKARKLGNKLVIGLNSDRSVRELKGEGRPVNSEQDRATVLAALSAVDLVIVFDELTPRDLITRVNPHILVKGGDYSREDIAGADWIEERGGKLVLMPLVKGQSTSKIIQKIQKLKS